MSDAVLLSPMQRLKLRDLCFAEVVRLEQEARDLPKMPGRRRSHGPTRRQRLEAEADRTRALAELFLE